MRPLRISNGTKGLGIASLALAIIAYAIFWIPVWNEPALITKIVVSPAMGLASATMAGAAAVRGSRWWWLALLAGLIVLFMVLSILRSATWKCEST